MVHWIQTITQSQLPREENVLHTSEPELNGIWVVGPFQVPDGDIPHGLSLRSSLKDEGRRGQRFASILERCIKLHFSREVGSNLSSE